MISVGFRADPDVGVILYLCKITALLDEPVYVYLAGPAASLKTTYADLEAKLTAPEMLRHMTDLTPKALYYGEADLSHFLIALDEMDLKSRSLAIDQKLLRMLHSKSWAEIHTTIGGKAVHKRVTGPVSVVQTTVALEFDPQDLSRHLLIELPDTPERTDIVLSMMGEHYAGQTDRQHVQDITAKHQAIHRLLPAGTQILVPFAPTLARLMPRDRIVVLRSLRTLLSLIKASALLHLRHRPVDGQGRIIADIDDYRLLYKYGSDLLAQSLASHDVPRPTMQWLHSLLDILAMKKITGGDGDNLRDLAGLRSHSPELLRISRRWDKYLSLDNVIQFTERPRSTVQRYLAQLQRAGIIFMEKAGKAYRYRLAAESGEVPSCPELPSPEQVLNGHLGTTRKPLVQHKIECPPDSELPTAKECINE